LLQGKIALAPCGKAPTLAPAARSRLNQWRRSRRRLQPRWPRAAANSHSSSPQTILSAISLAATLKRRPTVPHMCGR